MAIFVGIGNHLTGSIGRPVMPHLRYLNKLTAMLAGIAGGLLIISMIPMSALLWHEYYKTHSYDAVWWAPFGMLLFVLPALYQGGYLLRRFMIWLAFYRAARRQLVIAEYEIPLSPAEAGVYVNFQADHKEAVATIYDLQYRSYVRFEEIGKTLTIYRQRKNDNLRNHESVFLDRLFRHSNTLQLPLQRDLWRSAVQAMEETLLEEFIANSKLVRFEKIQNTFYFIQQVLWVFAVMYGLIFLSIITNSGFYSLAEPFIALPAERMLSWLVFLATLLTGILCMAAQAYLSVNPKSKSISFYQQASGLFVFIEAVYRKRLEDGHVAGRELSRYRPYAIAMGQETQAITKFKQFFR